MKEYLHINAIEIPMYRGYLVIIITNSEDKLLKHLPEFSSNYIYGHAWLSSHKDKQAFYMVLNFDSAGGNMTHGTIAHEALHITNFLADQKGFVPDFENDEPLAYIIGWVTDQAYKFIDKKKFKVKTSL